MDKQEKIVKGIFGFGILLVVLVMATGSASAANCGGETACNCGDTVTSDYTFTENLDCSGTTGHGLFIGADDVTIDGDEHWIKGNTSAALCRAGIYNSERDNVVIKDLEVKDFCRGIYIYGSDGDSLPENNTIDNCEIHDNGNVDLFGHGIDLYCANNSKITNCTIYDNSGEVEGSCDDGGMGIRLYGCECGAGGKGYHTVTNNTIYGNRLSGVFSKMGVKHCNVSYNRIYENGEYIDANDHYMSGGMRLECIATNNWTVEYNTITNNTGPGIYVRGDYNNISHNDVTNNNNASGTCDVWGTDVDAGEGIYLGGDHNNLTANRVCNNEYKDIYNHTSGTVGNHGDENICYLTQNWNDDGTTGCTYDCVYAYGDYNNSRPPATCDVPNNEFTTTEYNASRVKDGVSVLSETSSHTGNYATQRFNFTVREPAAKIDKIEVIWYGKGWHDNESTYNGTYLYIWNKTGNTGYNSDLNNTSSGNWGYLTGEVNTTDGISNYISANNNVTILAEQKSKRAIVDEDSKDSHIRTDLAKIVIYFKYP